MSRRYNVVPIPKDLRCNYCGKTSEKQFCSDECDEKFTKFKNFYDKWYKKRTILALLSFVFVIPAVFYTKYVAIFGGITLFLIGLVLFALPFSSMETFRALGIKNGIRNNRKYASYFILTGIMCIIAQTIIIIVKGI